MIIFLLFSFLFLPSGLETQAFASFDEISTNNIQISHGSYDSQYFAPRNSNDAADESIDNNGIDEDWMFGKNKTNSFSNIEQKIPAKR